MTAAEKEVASVVDTLGRSVVSLEDHAGRLLRIGVQGERFDGGAVIIRVRGSGTNV